MKYALVILFLLIMQFICAQEWHQVFFEYFYTVREIEETVVKKEEPVQVIQETVEKMPCSAPSQQSYPSECFMLGAAALFFFLLFLKSLAAFFKWRLIGALAWYAVNNYPNGILLLLLRKLLSLPDGASVSYIAKCISIHYAKTAQKLIELERLYFQFPYGK